MKTEMKFDDYTLRLLEVSDGPSYYKDGFENPDKASQYFTGPTPVYSKEQILAYVEKVTKDINRFDFIICDDRHIIGEVVINDIEDGCGHYRIALFSKDHFSKGIGYKSTKLVLDFAFIELGLEVIDLEVYPFNERGIALYKKLGFQVTGEEIDDQELDPYKKILMMSLKKEDYLIVSSGP